MADDGLLLNFSLGDGPLTTKSAITGGPWRARRRAQKVAAFSNGTLLSTQQPNSSENPDFGSRPAKRIRVDDSRPHSSKRSSSSANPTYEAPKQVVSSLFSFNPKATSEAAKEPAQAEDEPVEPSNAPLTKEQLNFVNLDISPSLAAHLTQKMNISAPTAIQKATIPQLIKEDADAFIQAETGSGKTLAYLLPIVQRIMQLSELKDANGKDLLHRDSGLFAIVLAPTRELSKQIAVVLDNLLRAAHWLVGGTVIGGEKKKSEKARLRKGLNILVATPGRLADHLEHTEALNVSNVRWLVLDEGDRLVELGFEADIKKIVSKLDFQMKKSSANPIKGLPEKRVNILCSATMKMDVQRLGEISLKDAVHIHASTTDPTENVNATTDDTKFLAPAQLKQSYAIVPAKLRLVSLAAFLKRSFARHGSVMKAIVFISCADSVDFHYEVFTRKEESEDTEQKESTEKPKTPKMSKFQGKAERKPPAPPTEVTTSAISPTVSSPTNTVTCYRLHGSFPQATRTKTLQAFTKDTSPSFLLCTDVASRGLDLPDIDVVIEYDPPFSKDEHLHRIGRTARAGRNGRAMIFLLPGPEEGYIQVLDKLRSEGAAGLARHTADELLKKGLPMPTAPDGKNVEDRATEWQLGIERWVLEHPGMLEAARRGYQSHIRAYATHVAAERYMFNIKELHLGHLAKAFGLRDKPGSINVPGLRQSAGKVKTERVRAGVEGGKRKRVDGAGRQARDKADLDLPGAVSADDAARRMRMKVKKMMGGASEFNIA
ncbi:ATP-dependent RNA helicase dbp7 [Trichodelitschia bisporula]|uniref:ATP-dependent RNA helicase n=1 Tax=Trichodelitschia bisporula TaxID=703511 RepID=A0A6G1HKJ6_9PEZI|nr:ATP-dependent RNA helicase dbp7 [Trichodelitschia bisporula]